MKSWIKGMLMVSAICVITGAVLGGAAWAMGGRFSYFRERSYGLVAQEEAGEDTAEVSVPEERPPQPERPEEAMVSQPQITEAETQRSVSEPLSQPDGGSSAEAGTAGRKAEFQGMTVSELDIIVERAKVELIEDESADTIQIICDDESYRCYQEMDEDTLEIHVRMRRNKDWSLFDTMDQWDKTAAQIIIPGNVLFDQVELEVAGGVLSADRINAGQLSMELQGGKMEVLSGSVGELSGDCQAGELTYEGQVRREMDADCQAGAVRYRIEGREEDFNYEIDAAVGRVSIGGTEISSLKKESVLNNPGAAKRAEVECEAGAVEIDFYQP